MHFFFFFDQADQTVIKQKIKIIPEKIMKPKVCWKRWIMKKNNNTDSKTKGKYKLTSDVKEEIFCALLLWCKKVWFLLHFTYVLFNIKCHLQSHECRWTAFQLYSFDCESVQNMGLTSMFDVELLRTHRSHWNWFKKMNFEHSQCVRHCINWMWVLHLIIQIVQLFPQS